MVLVHEWLDLGDDVHRVVRRAGIDVDHTHPRLKAAYQGASAEIRGPPAQVSPAILG